MADKFFRTYNLNPSGWGCLVPILLSGLLFGSIGLQWVVNGFLIFLALLIILPVVGVTGFIWWSRKNLVEASCPVCTYEFTGFNRTVCQCPNCGESLKVEGGNFLTLTPPDTIDVEAIEISSRSLEE